MSLSPLLSSFRSVLVLFSHHYRRPILLPLPSMERNDDDSGVEDGRRAVISPVVVVSLLTCRRLLFPRGAHHRRSVLLAPLLCRRRYDLVACYRSSSFCSPVVGSSSPCYQRNVPCRRRPLFLPLSLMDRSLSPSYRPPPPLRCSSSVRSPVVGSSFPAVPIVVIASYLLLCPALSSSLRPYPPCR